MLSDDIITQYRNDAQGLAEYFSGVYFKDRERRFPINPFQVLTDFGIRFVFRNFERLEGLFLPGTEELPDNLVAINAKRPITRQRFTAAHELCHYLKDTKAVTSFACAISADSYIEKYAEAFASAFLMPEDEFLAQIELRSPGEDELTLEDILWIADYFGTSFKACYYRANALFPYKVHTYTKKQLERFHPDLKRKELGLSYCGLYADLFDAWPDASSDVDSEFARQVFKNHYVYNDARMEGVMTTFEAAAEIIEDLQNNRQVSGYCTVDYEGYCNVAGHALMYDYIFEQADAPKFDIWRISALHKILFSCCPNPDFGGSTRKENAIITGAGFAPADWKEILPELVKVDLAVKELEEKAASSEIPRSEIIMRIAQIHLRFIVIHPFPDGNGRTGRGFLNAQLVRHHIPPIYIKVEKKEEYYNVLETAVLQDDFRPLYEFVFKAIIRAHVELAG